MGAPRISQRRATLLRLTPALLALTRGLVAVPPMAAAPVPAAPPVAPALSVPGDADGDGRVDVADAVLVVRAAEGLVPVTPKLLARADVAPRPGLEGRLIGDGRVDQQDAARLLGYLTGRVTRSDFGPEPLVTTLAGSGPAHIDFGGYQDGPGGQARFFLPYNVAADREGNLYVPDWYYSLIRKVTPDGYVTTVAGSPGSPPGVAGFRDGPALQALFLHPEWVEPAPDGTLYVADTGNHAIRAVSPDGQVRTVTGGPSRGFEDGPIRAARFTRPSAIVRDPLGTLYVADWGNDAVRGISRMGDVVWTVSGGIRPGFVDGPLASACWRRPRGLALAPDGSLYVADSLNHAIRKVTPDGFVITVAGTGRPGYRDATGTQAAFWDPMGLCFDSHGNLYVGDWSNEVIRRIAPDGQVTTVAGVPGHAGYRDGPASAALFSSPMGLALDPTERYLYVADTDNQRLRRIQLR